MKAHTLSPGAKVQALLLAGRIRFRAYYSAGHEAGFATESTRREMLEICALLESKGQPHRGRRASSGVAQMAYQLVEAAYPPMYAARYALAHRQWDEEYQVETSEKLKSQLQAELDSGLNKRMRDVPTKEAKRVIEQVKLLQAGPLRFK